MFLGQFDQGPKSEKFENQAQIFAKKTRQTRRETEVQREKGGPTRKTGQTRQAVEKKHEGRRRKTQGEKTRAKQKTKNQAGFQSPLQAGKKKRRQGARQAGGEEIPCPGEKISEVLRASPEKSASPARGLPQPIQKNRLA